MKMHHDDNNNKTIDSSNVDTSRKYHEDSPLRVALAENKAINSSPLLTASLNSPPVAASAVDLTATSGSHLHRKRMCKIPPGEDSNSGSNSTPSSSTCSKEMYANLLMQLRHQGITASEESVVITTNNGNKLSAAARKEKLKSQLCFQCPVCKKRFQRHIAMNAHFQAEHLGGTTSKSPEKVCKLCAFVGTDMISIRNHLLVEHNIDLETPTACLVEPESRSMSPLPSSSSDKKSTAFNNNNVLVTKHPFASSNNNNSNPAVSIIRTSVVPTKPMEAEIASTTASSTSSLSSNSSAEIFRSSPPVNVVIHETNSSYLLKSTSNYDHNEDEAKDLSIKNSVNLNKRCASASPGLDLVHSKKRLRRSSNNNHNNNHRIVMSSPSSPLNQDHLSSNASSSSSASVMSSLNSSQWQCQHCSIIFPDQTLYFLHRGFHSNTNPWKCNGCGQRCTDMYDFNTHLMSDVHH